MKTPTRFSRFLLALFLASPIAAAGWGQEKGEPGKFDFYLLNLSWSPEFCSIHDTGPECNSGRGFIVHGLWPQNNDGSYPVSCSERPGPQRPEENLDITPDLSLLKHEWAKHGTCTTLSPTEFFAAEHKAFHMVAIPSAFRHIDQEIQMRPTEVLDLFAKANPEFPPGGIVLSCGKNHLTAIEACLTKELKPTVCQNLRSCRANVVKIEPPETAH